MHLEKVLGTPVQIILFGFHVRGEAATDSDVDILIIVPKLGKIAVDIILEVVWEVSFESGLVFSAILVVKEEPSLLAESPFLQAVQREGILL